MLVLTVIAKTALLSGILIGAGMIFARTTLRPVNNRFTFLIQRFALVIATAGAIAGVAILVVRLGGAFDVSIALIVLQSSSGLAAIVLMFGALLGALHTRTMFVGASLIAIAAGIAGHASANSIASGMVVSLHVAAASWWTGGLLILVSEHGISDLPSFANVVNRFSNQARLMIAVLLAAGVWAIYDLLGLSMSALGSTYGKVLLAKLVLVLVLLCLALYNRLKIAPALNNSISGADSCLRKTILAELSVIALIIVVTALLTTILSPPQGAEMISSWPLRFSL